MIYSNIEFIVLFTITFFCFLAIRNYRARLFLLIASSMVFYMWAGVFHTFIFLFILLLSWAATALAKKYPQKKRFWLNAGIFLMLAHLFFWKYATWLTAEIQSVYPNFLFGMPVLLPLPIGISFFTLQGVAYLIDYSHGVAEFIPLPQYVLFKSFFSQLIAGPLVRARELMPQVRKLVSPNLNDITNGLSLFVLGFYKKVMIADRMAVFVDPIFANTSNYSRGTLLMGVFAYFAQIWGDFSGYTDMGRGTALMLGIRLPENFLSPYFSKSPSDFWNRWHITLSHWIRDYIYYPLLRALPESFFGSYNAPVWFTIIFTMFVAGIWHGANWTFLAFGLFWGFVRVLEEVLKKTVRPTFRKILPKVLQKAVLVVLMIPVIGFSFLLFRCVSLEHISIFMRGLFYNLGQEGMPEGYMAAKVGIFFCFAIQAVSYYSFTKGRFSLLPSIRNFFGLGESSNRSPVLKYMVIGLALGALMVGGIMRPQHKSTSFIYFQF